MKNELSQRAAVWSRYWSRGALHSCAGSFDDGYEGPIAAFWRQGFETLNHGARVLDIASGNGPVPRLLLDLKERADLSCDAIDLADVQPPWLEALPQEGRDRVRFHGRCFAEELPFADDSFSMVVSQWGLEYSDLGRSVPELLRVLAPGGTVRLLLHHEQALPVVLAAEEVEHLTWLMGAEGMLQTVAMLLAPMALAATPEGRERLMKDAQANALRDRFNAQQDELQLRIDRGRCVDVLDEVRAEAGRLFALASSQGEVAAQAAWRELSEGLEDALLRLQELRSHALDEAAARELADRLVPERGRYQLDVLRERGAIMGWALKVSPGP